MTWITDEKKKPGLCEYVLVTVSPTDRKPFVTRARWVPEHTEEDIGNYEGESDYCEEADTYYWPEGWYEEQHEYSLYINDPVIAWMPLPNPYINNP